MATWAEVTTPVTVDQAEALILGLLEALGFRPTSWQRFSFPRTFVRMVAELYADSRTGIVSLVKGGLLAYATGDFLDQVAESFFEEEREPATFTEGLVLLEDDGGAPYTIEPGQLTIQAVGTNLQYTNVNGGSLSVGGTLPLTFKAASPGAAYNIATGTPLEFVTTLEGVDVSNPDPGSGTWITSTGTDEQSDDSLRAACRAKWATLGAGTAPAYVAWALEGAPTVSKVKVYDDQPNGPGTVLVVLANDTGPASATEVANADAVIQAKRPIGLGGVEVKSAAAVPVVVNATVYVRSAYSGAYNASLATEVQTFQRELEVGDDIYRSAVNEVLHLPAGVRNVVITSPAGDTAVARDEIGTLQLGTITISPV